MIMWKPQIAKIYSSNLLDNDSPPIDSSYFVKTLKLTFLNSNRLF